MEKGHNRILILVALILFILVSTEVIYAETLWDYNQYIYKKTGIQTFHEAGYTGKNVNVGNYEKAKVEHEHFNGKLIDHYSNRQEDRHGSQHGDKTALILHSVVPDANIYLLNSSNTDEDRFITEVSKLIKEKNILVSNCSKDFATNGSRQDVMDVLVNDYNYKSIMSTGNFGLIGGSSGLDGMWRIGALDSGERREIYSGIGDEYGMMAYCVHLFPNFNEEFYKEGYPAIDSGTSFSSPLFAGMVALVDDFFIENTGQPLTHSQMLLFIEDHTQPLTDEYGVFVLPNPANIEVDNYIVNNEEGD